MRLTGVVIFALACLVHAAWAEPRVSIDRHGLSAAILAETNREREAHGLRPLRLDERLAKAADGHAKFLVLVGSIQHDSFLPGRHTVEDRVRAEGLKSALVSENLALVPAIPGVIQGKPDGRGIELVRAGTGDMGIDDLAAVFVRGWMESPPHRDNLLSPAFTHLGCAVQTSTRPASGMIVFSAQVFARL
jgi:uncharacterized protein YkwD